MGPEYRKDLARGSGGMFPREVFFLLKPLKRHFVHSSDLKGICEVEIYILNFTIILNQRTKILIIQYVFPMAILFVVKCKLTVLFVINECDLNSSLPRTQNSKKKKTVQTLATTNTDPGTASGRY